MVNVITEFAPLATTLTNVSSGDSSLNILADPSKPAGNEAIYILLFSLFRFLPRARSFIRCNFDDSSRWFGDTHGDVL